MNERAWHRGNQAGGLMRVGLSCAILLGLSLLIAQPSHADDPMDRPLELFYQRLVRATEWQSRYLEVAAKLKARAQQWIDELTARGQDTSGLVTALEAFKDRLEEAERLYDEALAILDAHDGFDEEGHVVDRTKAIRTLMQAARALRQAQLALWRGTLDLRGITRDWRRGHQPWLFGR